MPQQSTWSLYVSGFVSYGERSTSFTPVSIKFLAMADIQGPLSMSDWTMNPESVHPHCVRVLRRPVIRPDVQLLRLAIVAEGGD